jgi:hypothetical protein
MNIEAVGENRILDSAIREFLRDLFAQPEGMDLYVFHEKYQLTPGQLLTLVEYFEKQLFVERQEYKVQLTPSGRAWVLLNRGKLFLQKRKKTWKEMPEFFRGRKIEPAEPYIPKRKNLNLKFFEKLSK